MDERSWTVTGKAPLRFWGAPDTAASPPADVDESASDLQTQLLAAVIRAQTAERDRDWWKAQHDVIMEDWRLDVAQISVDAAKVSIPPKPIAAAPPPPPAAKPVGEIVELLGGLLQFYDARDGSIAFQREGRTLSDAFQRAASWLVRNRP